MSKRLFVGGLSYSTTEESLKAAFAQAGNVESAVIITDRATGRSKGFGFVEVSTDEDAEKAISMLNGQELDGRKINVNVARPREEKRQPSFSRSY
ncbi:RNA-binding protein [Patescibacteria group bacterium]|nr:RNA-binding protein [Candidatus Margulisiibacteriota bacterium]MBU1682667.1 RNA-binding protein [Patescibacteria group bacterium]